MPELPRDVPIANTTASGVEFLNQLKQQAALLQTEALQNAIFNSANFSSIATDAQGVIQIFNVGAERMLGYTAIDVLDRITPADLSDQAELIARANALSLERDTTIKPGFEALVFKASRGIEDIYELTYIRKDGSRCPAVVSVTALRDLHDAIIGYLLIGSSDTARRRFEAELLGANDELRKSSLAKSAFLVQLSYALRTPLNVILGFAQLMESGFPRPPPAQALNLDQILVAGRYLLELTNQIFNLAVVESGKESLLPEQVSVAEVLLDCQSMIVPEAKKRFVKVIYPNLEASIYVRADRTKLKQILMHLIANAVKYNKPGGAVAIGCAPSPNVPQTIRISVRDSGKGLTADQFVQLFQPFNRLGQEGGDESGIGMGLVVSKQLIELMGGSIGVNSAVGEGSVFWIELPVAEPPAAVSEAHRDNPVSPQLANNAGPLTVLYVEDNPANMELIRQVIARRPDVRLLTALDALQGIESARVHLPDVILMDINLPGLSGIDAMNVLRADVSVAHIPIIALSANAMPDDFQKGIAAGFFSYITKPVKLPQFMEVLDTALAFSQAAKSHLGKRNA